MNLDGDVNTNEYIVTASQIFDYCGVDSSSTIHVETLMDKFAPFVKTNKTEYSYLRSLLDPDQLNPEITVSKLASTLNQYSENQKIKIDLDESFNLKGGQLPQDSDSGISNDGFQILEELQCELREKSHLAHQLRNQLELTDRHHEEALGALVAERDTLKAQLSIMREENASLSRARQDYEEACERLGGSERALSEARHELAAVRRRALRLADQLAVCEAEKLTLQELLTKSKDECHRINEMYASRQSLLLEENETLKTDHADISSRLQDQEEFMQQMIKEKVLLEMELKDVLNKSNHIHSRMDRSIDVSYTEDQMLTALDSLNTESKFIQDSRILDEDSFLNALNEDTGHTTNMSLFDEIRLSFYNKSKLNLSELNCTEFFEKRYEHVDLSFGTVATQTDDNQQDLETKNYDCKQTIIFKHDINNICIGIQTDKELIHKKKYKKLSSCTQTERDVPNAKIATSDTSTNTSAQIYEVFKDEEFDVPNVKVTITDVPNFKVATTDTSTNTSTQIYEVFKDIEVMNFGIQADMSNGDNIQSCTKCEKQKEYATNLENDLRITKFDFKKQINWYEKHLNVLKIHVEETNAANTFLKSLVDNLKSKINILESAYVEQSKRIDSLPSKTICEPKCDQTSIGTQVVMPCTECVKRSPSSWSMKGFFWESMKCLFQLFAVVCFVCAVCVLYGVRRLPSTCRELPARWLRPADLLDLLLRVEYVAEVPM